MPGFIERCLSAPSVWDSRSPLSLFYLRPSITSFQLQKVHLLKQNPYGLLLMFALLLFINAQHCYILNRARFPGIKSSCVAFSLGVPHLVKQLFKQSSKAPTHIYTHTHTSTRYTHTVCQCGLLCVLLLICCPGQFLPPGSLPHYPNKIIYMLVTHHLCPDISEFIHFQLCEGLLRPMKNNAGH